MPDPKYFSKVKLLDGTVAEVYDEVARQAIAGGTHFIGVTTTAISDGSSTNPITIGEDSVTAKNGDIVVYGNKEFIFASNDSKWHELGDTTGLGALALKDSVSATYTPAGTVSKPDITVTPTSATVKEIDTAGSVVAGTANVPTAVAVTNGTANVPTVVQVTAGTADVPTEVSVTPGSANVPTAVTLPTLATTLNGTTLELSWTAGSVIPGTAGTPTAVSVTDGVAGTPTVVNVTPGTAGTPTAVNVTPGTAGTPTTVTLPTTKNTSVLTAVAAELAAAPEFSGTQATIVSE